MTDPFHRDDFRKTGEDDFDEWSPVILQRYMEDHGNMREMVRHHLDAYEHFIHVQEEETIQSFNPIFVKCDDDQVAPGRYRLELRVYMQKLKSELPKVQENDGELKLLFPSEARVRNISYCSRQTIQFRLEYTRRNDQGDEIEKKTVLLPDMFFMNMFVMLRSSLCNTQVFSQMSSQTVNECSIDPGGYFVVKGQEKTIMNHLGKRNNVLVVLEGGPNHKYSYHASIKYLQEGGTHSSAKQVDMYVMAKSNLMGCPLMISTPRLRDKEFINLFVMFRALGAGSDREIMNFIFDPNSVNNEQREAIEQYLFATMYAAPRDVIDQVSAIQYIKNLIEFDVNHFIKEEANDRRRLNQTLTMLRDEIFPQYKYSVAVVCPSSSSSAETTIKGCTNGRQEKMFMLGYMARQIIWTALGWVEPDSRDSYLNKRMNGVNVILNDFLRPNLQKVVKTMQVHMNKHLRKERKRALQNNVSLDLNTLFVPAKMTKMFRSWTLQKNFDKAMQTGDFSTSGYTKRAGYCQMLKRLSMMDAIGHMRRVSTTPDKNNEEIVENRKYDPKHTGHLCLVETPDTNAVGQILQLAIGAHSSLFASPHALMRALDELSALSGMTKIGEMTIDRCSSSCKMLHCETRLFVNGVWLANVKRPMELFTELKRRKCNGKLHVHTSIVFDFPRNEIRLSTESGRTVRPVLRVDAKDQKIMLTSTHLQLLRARQLRWTDLVAGGQLFAEGVIEYIDAEEEWLSSIAIPCNDLYKGRTDRKYDYAEISYLFSQGFCAAQIPYIGMNPSARNTFMTNMGKQPVGIYVTNFDKRMDRTGYVQAFPGTPLVRNHLYTSLGLNYVPCGKQVNMCLICYDGTNQEDSVTFNADSVDRGLFAGFLLHTEKEEDKSLVRESLLHAKPDPATTIGIKNADYSKLNRFGVVNPNHIVRPNQVYLAKVVPITGVKAQIRQIGDKGICYEDHSHIHTKTVEDAYVQSNYVGRGGDGQVITKTTLRMYRTPSLGDKFATRQAQKVTLGRKTPGFLMPYSKINGTIPDVLYNMHCMPTRMTVGTIMEMCMGKVCVTIGAFANGSQTDRVSDSPIGNLQKLLSRLNLDSNVQDVLVNPHTGRIMQARVFHGPINVQNLKHQTIDKAHFRNIGPNVKQTRQPTEGRSRDGGTKFGEMERDVTTAVGAVETLRDRLFECSDKFSVYVCKGCGLFMAGNNGQEYFSRKESSSSELLFRKEFYCRLCENRSRVSLVQIPYGFKLFAQEQMSINVVPRIIT